ncbi:MAG: sigma 54-interacting transcriptional regulator [Terracidiphilus sp.]
MSAQNLLQPQHLRPQAFDLSNAEAQHPFIAISTAARRLFHQVEVVAPHLQIATIEGETGVGKQTIAQLLHSQSAHARSTFQRCDAREWLLDEVDPQFLSGFIYLDRVDLLAAPGQALLLRVLRSLPNRPTDTFALLASSERSLRDLASEGRFLPDLAFRLTAIHFVIPPLRERREDIVPLATFFLESIGARYHLPRLSLAPGATACLLQHNWPANAGELSSVLESAVLNAPHGIIHAEDLAIVSTPLASPRPAQPSAEFLNLDAVILNHIRMVLDLNHNNKLKTARQLGISRSTLYRLLGADAPSSL